MSNHDSESRGEQSGDDMIGRIIKSAGRGPSAPPEVRARVYSSANAAWRKSLSVERPRERILDRPLDRPRERPGRRPLLWLAAAASVGIAVLLVDLQQTRETQPIVAIAEVGKVEGAVHLLREEGERRLWADGAPAPIVEGDTLRTAEAGKAAIELSTGSILRMNEQTEVRFDSPQFVSLERGTVYLDTGGGTDSGDLEVRTPIGSIRHLGTQYEVHLEDSRLRVRVREGSVLIRGSAGELVTQSGEQILIPESGAPVQTSIAASDPAWNWVEDLAVVSGADAQSLMALLRWLTRETGQALRFADSAAESEAERLMLHGVGGLTPAEVLTVIRDTTSLSYTQPDGVLLVSRDE